MIYYFLDPLNEVDLNRCRRATILPIQTKKGIKPLIILKHVRDRYEERALAFFTPFPELEIPFKTVISNFVKHLNKNSNVFDDPDASFVSRTYINIVSPNGTPLGCLESGISCKCDEVTGTPSPNIREELNKFKLDPNENLLYITTYMILATGGSRFKVFSYVKNAESALYKTVTMTPEDFGKLTDISNKEIKKH